MIYKLLTLSFVHFILCTLFFAVKKFERRQAHVALLEDYSIESHANCHYDYYRS